MSKHTKKQEEKRTKKYPNKQNINNKYEEISKHTNNIQYPNIQEKRKTFKEISKQKKVQRNTKK